MWERSDCLPVMGFDASAPVRPTETTLPDPLGEALKTVEQSMHALLQSRCSVHSLSSPFENLRQVHSRNSRGGQRSIQPKRMEPQILPAHFPASNTVSRRVRPSAPPPSVSARFAASFL